VNTRKLFTYFLHFFHVFFRHLGILCYKLNLRSGKACGELWGALVAIMVPMHVSSKVGSAGCVLLCCVSLFLTACAAPGYVPVYSASYDIKPSQPSYKVRKEDTLFSIAWRYQLDYQELARINGVVKPFRIYPGQVLLLHPDNVEAFDETKHNNKNTAKNNKSKYDKPKSNKQHVNLGSLGYGSENNRVKVIHNWVWPASGKVVPKYASGKKVRRKGLDVLGNYGDPVRAAANGKIVYSGGGLLGYGNLIIIEHSEEYLSAYAHNSKLLSKESDYVKAGQKIAEVGSSGARRSKLYFEIRRKGVPVDPVRYLPKR